MKRVTVTLFINDIKCLNDYIKEAWQVFDVNPVHVHLSQNKHMIITKQRPVIWQKLNLEMETSLLLMSVKNATKYFHFCQVYRDITKNVLLFPIRTH